MPSHTLIHLPSLAAALLIGLAPPAAAQSPPNGSFVATLGRDTVAFESYAWSGDTLSGSSLTAYPTARVRSYRAVLGVDGGIRHLHLEVGPAGAAPSTIADYVYGRDSVRVEVRRDTTTRRFAVATDGDHPLPFFEDLFAFWEMAARRFAAGSADSATIQTVAGRRLLPVTFRRGGASTVELSADEWGSGRIELRPDGGARSFDMTGTTTKYAVERVPSVDLAAHETAWAARPQPGSLSPRDTASAEIGSATVAVDYGRPSMRGRQVFGGIVPFGQVWRTGANAATQLITDHDLEIGGQPVPAGTYTLWTIPGRDGWTLIVNRQHGQWGTEYHPDQDLVRVPLTVTRSDRPVERFTITVAGGEAGEGSIALAWERTRATVEVRVKEEP
ncbi:MAG: DUF2911 domain-containing protein [Candidatus Palauibacterales bacterium]|nr:DUF2911 domain-containing protein [Candidatus Palauibacterales bacterium]MDP2529592.1 DUF2911 domain-containing protein [Candidatus Palauibacterales bacterium]MDP2582619.1 DUF2911 domain-containing protein [Candidatus Palauibacterales bacterium]